MWETRCFLPAQVGSVLADTKLRETLFHGAPPEIFSCLGSSVWDAAAKAAPEDRTDVYFCIPGPAGAFVGLKLRGGTKAEAKVVTGISSVSQPDNGMPVAAQWTKYQHKLKHGFRKKKKMVKFLSEIDLPHAAAAAATIAQMDEDSLGEHQMVVQKSRKLVPLDAAGLVFEEAHVRLSLLPSGGESDSREDDGDDLGCTTFSTPPRQERSSSPAASPSIAVWSMVSWSVEGSSPTLVEQVGLLWSRHVIPRMLLAVSPGSESKPPPPSDDPTDATRNGHSQRGTNDSDGGARLSTPFYGLLSYPEVCNSLWSTIAKKQERAGLQAQASRL